jgi:hypothetical protein
VIKAGSEALNAAHVQSVVDAQMLAVKLETADRSDFTLKAFGLKVFDHFLDQDIFDSGLIQTIWRQALKELAELGCNQLGGVIDLENNHKKDADGET